MGRTYIVHDAQSSPSRTRPGPTSTNSSQAGCSKTHAACPCDAPCLLTHRSNFQHQSWGRNPMPSQVSCRPVSSAADMVVSYVRFPPINPVSVVTNGPPTDFLLPILRFFTALVSSIAALGGGGRKARRLDGCAISSLTTHSHSQGMASRTVGARLA